MTDDTASTTSGSVQRAASTIPTSKSVAFSDSGSVVSAPINNPAGHPGTRANTDMGDPHPFVEIHAHHIHARLLSSLSSSTLPSIVISTENNNLARIPTEESEGVLEYSNWGDEAEETMRGALAILAQLARDENKADPSKSVEEFFSQRLAKLVREGEVKFDVGHLQ